MRTGALYHDIGKMENPVFFTENQSGGVNPHKNLSYEQSAQVIISHVTDGLKLAEKNNLPKVIKDFISTHHGKGKTKYFYISWKNEHPDEEPNEELFTYPGPNPFTRETAILMMADAVEAASRSLPEYNGREHQQSGGKDYRLSGRRRFLQRMSYYIQGHCYREIGIQRETENNLSYPHQLSRT